MYLRALVSLFFTLQVLGFSPTSKWTRSASSFAPLRDVTDVGSKEEMDSVVGGTDKLIVVDYSTTWCGPCKIVLPKFIELSERYPDVTFLKVIGDTSTEASALMKREGVRSVPAFHVWKNNEKVYSVFLLQPSQPLNRFSLSQIHSHTILLIA
jgi:thioredoxin 1